MDKPGGQTRRTAKLVVITLDDENYYQPGQRFVRPRAVQAALTADESLHQRAMQAAFARE